MTELSKSTFLGHPLDVSVVSRAPTTLHYYGLPTEWTAKPMRVVLTLDVGLQDGWRWSYAIYEPQSTTPLVRETGTHLGPAALFPTLEKHIRASVDKITNPPLLVLGRELTRVGDYSYGLDVDVSPLYMTVRVHHYPSGWQWGYSCRDDGPPITLVNSNACFPTVTDAVNDINTVLRADLDKFRSQIDKTRAALDNLLARGLDP
jgi:hypothetical protein